MKLKPYLLLIGIIGLMLLVLSVTTTEFDTVVVSDDDSMVRFTVTDFILMFGLPLCAILHGILTRIMLKNTLLPHIIWFSAIWLWTACVFGEHPFSVPGLSFATVTTVLSLLSSLLTQCFRKDS